MCWLQVTFRIPQLWKWSSLTPLRVVFTNRSKRKTQFWMALYRRRRKHLLCLVSFSDPGQITSSVAFQTDRWMRRCCAPESQNSSLRDARASPAATRPVSSGHPVRSLPIDTSSISTHWKAISFYRYAEFDLECWVQPRCFSFISLYSVLSCVSQRGTADML